MRRITKVLFLVITCLLLCSVSTVYAGNMPGVDPLIDENYNDVEFMGEYIEGGMMIEGSSLRTSYPYLDYDFSNITKNGEQIKADQINTSFAADNLFIYKFDVTVSNDFLLIQPADYENMYSHLTTSGGETFAGSFVLTPVNQSIHVTYNPDLSISECITLEYDCKYTYSFTISESGEKRTGNISFQKEVHPYLSDQTNGSSLDFEEVLQKIDYPNLILMQESTDSFYGVDENGNELVFEMTQYSVPFVVEGGRIIYAYASTGDYEVSEEITPVEKETDFLVPIVSVFVLVGTSAAVAAVGSAIGNAASSGAGFVDMVTKRLEKEKAYYKMEFNGGVDLPPVICEADKVIEIPFRIDGGEGDQWIFWGKTICERNHKKVILTRVLPSLMGSSIVRITLKGDEVVKKEKVQVSVVALNPKKVSQTMLGVFEFDLIKKETSSEKKV